MQSNGPLKSAVRVIAHQWGLLGCRVGEASNPGPVQTRSAKLRTTQLDSDPEQVVTGGRYALLSGWTHSSNARFFHRSSREGRPSGQCLRTRRCSVSGVT